jgi:hypothetical protein
MSSVSKPSIPLRILNFFSSVGLATTLILILMAETWLATLEQVNNGLFVTLQRYFNPQAWYVIPDAGIIADRFAHKGLPPLPGGYWVCALLAVNILLGGVIRMKKGWKNLGILLAHCGIVGMIVAGGIAQLSEQRGVMMLRKDQTSDYAQDLLATTVEISEIRDGKVVGAVHLIDDTYYSDLAPADGKTRKVLLPSLPFDIELTAYLANATPKSALSMAPEHGEHVVDNWFLMGMTPDPLAEKNTPGVHALILPKDGSARQVALLAVASYQPLTYHSGDRAFAIRLAKRVWPVPFQVRLDAAHSKFFPNTSRPKSFDSNITRIEDGRESKVFIEMNAPMRYAGYTFYQRTMEGGEQSPTGEATVSGFEVVRNPSDKWPKYSIIVTGIGLFGHFVFKLAGFIFGKRSTKKA